MLEFKVIQELEPNNKILNIIKNSTFTTKNGRVKHLLKTNLQFIEPTEYLITNPITLTILEYKVNEISNKNFFNKFSKIFIQNLAIYMELIKAHFYADGIINCPYIENGNIIDNLTLISKNVVEIC